MAIGAIFSRASIVTAGVIDIPGDQRPEKGNKNLAKYRERP